MTRKVGYALLLALYLAVAGRARAESPTLWVNGPRIALADLIEPAPAAVDLGPAPPPGGTRWLTRERLLAALPDATPETLPRRFAVRTRAQRLSCAQLERLVAEALAPALRPGLTLRSAACRAPLLLPAGPVRLTAQLGELAQQAGLLSARIEVQAGLWPAQHLVLPVVVDGMVTAVVARRTLSAGAIAPDAVALTRSSASALPADTLTALEELGAKRLRWSVQAGAPLRRSMLQTIPDVTRGKTVTVATTLPSLRITTQGVVREDGAVGDVVLVQCLPSNQLVRARVLNARRVEVEL